MSEHEAERPMSRRERRLLEQQGTEPVVETPQPRAAVRSQEPAPEPVAEISAEGDVDVEISALDEDGNRRSRREIRELRQAMIEQRASERGDADDEGDEIVASSDLPTEALTLADLEQIEEDRLHAADLTVHEDEKTDGGDSPAEPLIDAGEEQGEAESYSFPDIQPLQEDPPIFDDPSVRTIAQPESEVGVRRGTAFDDVIERAVADESATVQTSTSSLILPMTPRSDDLSGPLGATGELFVTGSIDLPRTFGETGGHARLQDSVQTGRDHDDEGIEMLGLSDIYETSEFDSAPVSAKQAVSTKSIDGGGMLTPEVQKDGKKPLVLALTGGGLLLILVAGGVWAYTSGLFG